MTRKTLFVGLLTALVVLALLFGGAAPSSAAQGLLQNPTQTATALETQQATPGGQQITPTEQPVTPAAPQTQAQNNFQSGVLAQFQEQLTGLFQQVEPSVVSITIYGAPGSGSPFDGFPNGQPNQQGQPDTVPLGAGSGFIWDDQGHVVTNNHVVENADNVEVTFYNGTTVPATVVGTDPDSDLAVVKIDDLPDFELQPVRLSSLENVQVGQLAIAVGNPFGLQGTMTIGIVSAIGRSLPVGTSPTSYVIPSVIQTDAPINPGNSGGVLVNIQGELIGVPSAIRSTSGVGSGVGFAIPADIVDRVVPVLIQDGDFQHPYLGISGTALTPAVAEQMGLDRGTKGALIIDVAPDGPAAEAGLQGGSEQVTINGQRVPIGGDVITAINGQEVQSMDELINYLTLQANAGEEVTLTVIRNGKSEEVEVTLGTRPETTQVPATGGQAPGLPGMPGQNGQRESENQTRLGVMATEITPEIARQLNLPEGTTGVFVSNVMTNSPASRAGLTHGDVITAFDGQPVRSPDDLVQAVQNAQPGDKVQVTVIRGGNEQELTVTFDASATPESSGQGEGTRQPTTTPKPQR